MSTDAISSYYSRQYQSLLNGTSDGTSSSSSTSSSSLLSSGMTLGAQYSSVSSQIQSLLADVPTSGSKLTFQDVIDYRDQLQEKFENQARSDLAALGVDVDQEFALNYDASTDTVTASAGTEDKDIIDQYFADNEDMRDLFAQVVTYNDLLEPTETKLTPSQIKTQLEATSMSIWFEDNLDDSSSLGTYGNLLFNSASSSSSSSQYFGLDLQV